MSVPFNNQKARENFLEFLDVQQKAPPSDGYDIRAKILSLRNKQVCIGFSKINLEQTYAVNMKRIFPCATPIDEGNWKESSVFLASGIVDVDPEISHKAGGKIFELDNLGQEIILVEQGFLASTHSWSHAFQARNPKLGCLGYVYDDIAHYFMADYPNRLIHKLNGDEELSAQELERTRRLISRIVTNKVSKYNAQPIHNLTMSEGYARRVLVVDQNFQDASTIFGKLDETRFEQMLCAAIRENPDAEILVKAHPDTAWEQGKRIGYYTHLRDSERVRFIREPINPYMLFDHVDTVYVGSSQMGLEALFAGKKVVCFGAPFFSGWGFTDDRQKVPHRRRKRTLEEVFHYFYIWYTIYHVPEKEAPSEIEDVLDYIEQERPVALPPSAEIVSAPPKISVIVPVYGVEREIRECIESIQKQTLKELEIITVNDCSPDSSQAIIDEMATEDRRIRPIVLKENVGQGFARNRGLDAARGEYIWFLDADDFFATNLHLETVYDVAKADGCDMVRGRKLFERVEDKDGKFLRLRRDNSEAYFDEPFSRTTYIQTPILLHSRHFCNWLYRRELLDAKNIRFVNTQWEERPFLTKALVEANCISTTLSEAFIYRIRPRSTARREKNARDYDLQLFNFEETIRLLVGDRQFDREHPYYHHVVFTVSQFLHYIFLGFIYPLVKAKKAADRLDEFYARLRRVLMPLKLTPNDLVSTPINLYKKHVDAHAYKLIYASIMADHPDYVDAAVKLEPVDQDMLYEVLLKAPLNKAERDFQGALNMYARNERVRQKKESWIDGAVRAIPLTDAAADKRDVRIILHIGSTKTGSTYLQHLMEQNRPVLLQQGIWYPEVGLFWQANRPHKQAGHAHFAPAAIQGKEELRDYVETGLDILRRLGSPIHTIVLSSEAFFLNENAPLLADYFGDYDTRMIVYLRRQDDWANSQYAEFVAGGAVGRVSESMADWLRLDVTRKRLDYYGILERWAEKLDRSRIIVRPFERSQLCNNDLVSDFAAAVNLPQLRGLPLPPDDKTNLFPLENSHIHVVRQFNRQEFGDRENYFAFIDEVTRRLVEKRAREGREIKRPWLLTAEQSVEILRSAEESNALIAKAYLGRSNGQLFVSAEPRVPPVESEVLELAEYNLIIEAYERNRAKPSAQEGRRQKKAGAQTGSGASMTYDKLYTEACTHFHAGRFASALKKFNEARQLQPNNANVRRCMAETFVMLGRFKDAIPHLEKAHSLVPGNVPIARRLKEVRSPLFGRFFKGKPFPVPKGM